MTTLSTSIRTSLARRVDAGELAAAAALVWRQGETIIATVGRRDLTSDQPVERDTIFRIASMTKAVTTVAALTMLDEGRFTLDESITRCAPELRRMHVLRNPDGSLDDTEDATREITFRDLSRWTTRNAPICSGSVVTTDAILLSDAVSRAPCAEIE